MALFVVATPIGHKDDISLRALDILKQVPVVIGEERKEVSKLLRSHGITGKELELLNEHSEPFDVERLMNICRERDVALVTDCGTPGFCDPGARLVALCRKQQIQVQPIPGASSLMTFLSGCGREVHNFYFRGFLPANREERAQAFKELKSGAPRPVILMDTPYRLTRLLEELKEHFPKSHCTIGVALTQPEEQFLSGSPEKLLATFSGRKEEFILLMD